MSQCLGRDLPGRMAEEFWQKRIGCDVVTTSQRHHDTAELLELAHGFVVEYVIATVVAEWYVAVAQIP